MKKISDDRHSKSRDSKCEPVSNKHTAKVKVFIHLCKWSVINLLSSLDAGMSGSIGRRMLPNHCIKKQIGQKPCGILFVYLRSIFHFYPLHCGAALTPRGDYPGGG